LGIGEFFYAKFSKFPDDCAYPFVCLVFLWRGFLKFAVIIPTFNEQETIQAAIASAQTAGVQGIFIADGGSQDQTKELVEQSPNCRFISCPKPGRGYQQRFVSQTISADVIIFLHADSRLHANSIKEISKILLRQGSTDCWGGFYQRINHSSLAYRFLEFGNWLRSRLFGLVYGDQGIWVTSKALQEVGGVPDIPIMEDVVLSQKLRKISWPKMLSAKTITSSRRWEKDGIFWRTISNWKLLWKFRRGASPEEILLSYRPNRED